MDDHRAAGYPFDPAAGRFAVAVPCWLSTLELMALGHALSIAEGGTAEDGVEALRGRCRIHRPPIEESMLDRADWQEVVAEAFKAAFDPQGIPAFIGDYGWSLPAEGVRTALAILDASGAELHAAMRPELDLCDLVSERLAADPPPVLPRLDWNAGKPPSEELPPQAPALARRISERLNAIAAGVDPGPVPSAMSVLEGRASDEVAAMMSALREALAPLRSAEDLPEATRELRRLLEEARRLGVGVYLAFG